MSRRRPAHGSGRGPASERVAEEIRVKASEILVRELRDPRLAGIHLTRVEVSADLGHARLYYRTLPGGAPPEELEPAASRAAGFLRQRLGRSLRLKATPEMELVHDTAPDALERIDALLQSVRRPGDPADADG